LACGAAVLLQNRAPSLSTIRRSIRRIPTFRFGINEQAFVELAELYTELLTSKGIPLGSVLCEHSEDETAVKREVVYDQKTGELLGF
jgi:hypothetical protein